MNATRLLLLLLLIVVAVGIVVVVLRRGASHRDAQRAEAAGLRSEAGTVAASMSGQQAFAEQAEQRAELARVEAEAKAREAEARAAEAKRLEDEAARHRETVEASRREYEQTMRRADDIDPDVKESQFPPVEEEMTRAQRREARDAAEDGGAAVPAAGAAGAVGGAGAVGAVGAGATGASAWRAEDDEAASPESRRIAAAADYRDDLAEEPRGVSQPSEAGSGAGMSDETDTQSSEHLPGDHGIHASGSAADSAAAPDRGPGTAADVARDVESPQGEWGGPHQGGEEASATILTDTDAYAATEPVMASEQGTGVTPERDDDESGLRASHGSGSGTTEVSRAAGAHGDADRGGADFSDAERGDADRSVADRSDRDLSDAERGNADFSDADHRDADRGDRDLSAGDAPPAEVGAAVADPGRAHGSAADVAEQPADERFDPTPSRDWAADEGELLEENSQRADALAADRADLASQEESTASVGRRISAFEELRDGGYGVGSAAPLDDGAQPLDHPVQAYRDTMTYRAPGDPGYDSAEPHVWFYDEAAAERSGFRRAGG